MSARFTQTNQGVLTFGCRIALQLRFMLRQGEDHLWDISSVEIKISTRVNGINGACMVWWSASCSSSSPSTHKVFVG